MTSRSAPTCLEKATDLLARRSHFRRQLRDKLVKRGYPDEEIEAALDRLEELGYLDDHRTAAELVALRRARGEGARRIRAELERRGSAPEAVEAALADLPRDDAAQARTAAESWLTGRGRGKTGQRRREALARFLDRKGFPSAVVYQLLDDLGPEPFAEEEFPE